MQVIESHIKGVYEIIPKKWEDHRGYFFESFHVSAFQDNQIPTDFVQDNQSFSYKGVLRGLHLQKQPYSQAKLVCVFKGKALDVIVDLRLGSDTFGKIDTFYLDNIKNNRIYIPEGIAHGFVALEDCILSYKCSKYYNKSSETGIIWNDEDLNIDWQVEQPIISEKDAQLPTLKEYIANIKDEK